MLKQSISILLGLPKNSSAATRTTGGNLPLLGHWLSKTRSHRIAGRWLELGACAFPISPNTSAAVNPAIWLPDIAPTVIVIARTPPGFAGIALEAILRGRMVMSDYCDGADRHLVLTDNNGFHRLMITEPDNPGGHHAAILPDDCWSMRMAAALQFFGKGPSLPIDCLRPTAIQRHRLIQMLQVLDCLDAPERLKPSLRQIAETILYPRQDLGRAAEWKCSSQRRQTQRLVTGARRFMQGGYCELLKGRISPVLSRSCAGAIGARLDPKAIEEGNLPQGS